MLKPVPPTIADVKASPNNMSASSGHSVVILCTASGHPTPTITWFKDNVELDAGGADVGVLEGGQRLEIGAVEVDHTGRYRCEATNAAGQASREYDLQVLG